MTDALTQLYYQLSNGIALYLPRVVAALLLALVAWLVAVALQAVTRRLLTAVRLDERIRSVGLSNTIGNLVFYLVLLLFLPAILDQLQLTSILGPVQGLTTSILAFIPNLIGAAIILVVGFFVARIARELVTNLAAAVGVDRLGARVGLSAGESGRLSNVLGLIVWVLIFIPALTAALDTLGLPAVTQPISAMLNTFLAALPNIFGAVILLTLAYFVARLVSNVVSNLLANTGLDSLPARLGISQRTTAGGRRLSDIVGTLLLVAIMLFASVEAFRLLGFVALADLVNQFIVLAGQIVLGLIIFAIGLGLARVAYRAILDSGMDQANLLANIARAAILILAGAIALRQMGLANEIVTLAFGLTLGAIAVAAALAFGLGGREPAARVLEDMRQSVQSPADQLPVLPPQRTQ
jgi:hypothetical protein